MTLTEFVLARIAERERDARAALGDVISAEGETHGSWWAAGDAVMADAPGEYLWVAKQGSSIGDTAVAAHIARWDPAAVLARCAVDRQIVQELVDLEQETRDVCALDLEAVPVELDAQRAAIFRVVRLLGSLDADHPDYDDAQGD